VYVFVLIHTSVCPSVSSLFTLYIWTVLSEINDLNLNLNFIKFGTDVQHMCQTLLLTLGVQFCALFALLLLLLVEIKIFFTLS